MKKYLAIVLSAVFVLGLAATAFAIHAEIPSETQAVVAKGATQITLGGSLRYRGEMKKNTSDFNDDADDSNAAYDGRVRLSLDAKVADNVQGYVMLEANTGTSCTATVVNTPTGDKTVNSCTDGTNTSDGYTWGSASAAKGGYTEGNGKRGALSINEGWILFKGPVGLKVGHMPLALGNKLFFDHTKFGDDAILIFADPTPMVHVAALTAKFTESGAKNDNDADTYVVLATVKTDMVSGGANITMVNDQNLFDNPEGATLYNLGLNASVMAGPVSIMGDVELQSGKAENAAGAGSDVKFKGYALMLGASAKLGMVNVGLEAAMGSGDDDDTDNDVSSFITSLGTDKHFTYVYEYRTLNACGQASGGLCNTTYVKASASTKMGAVGVGADLYWLKATETEPGQDDAIGIEFDAKVTYALAKNLTYWVEGGYLAADDFYKVGTKDPDAAYALRHGIELSF